MNIRITLGVIIDFIFVLILTIILYTLLIFFLPYFEIFISKGFFNKDLISLVLLTGFGGIIIPFLVSLCYHKYIINIAYLSLFIYTFSIFNHGNGNPSYYFFLFMVFLSLTILVWSGYQAFIKKSRKFFLGIPLILLLAVSVGLVDIFISTLEPNIQGSFLQNFLSFLLGGIFGLIFNFITLDNKKEGLGFLYKKLNIIGDSDKKSKN